jgi:hypothetical protein
MLATQFDLNVGLDPSSLASLTPAQLLQMFQQSAPLSNIGFTITGAGSSLNAAILQGAGSPSVTNNPRFARYIWLNTFNAAAAPTPYYYDASTSLWRSTSVAAGSIIDASISAMAEIQVSKLQDGNANEIIATNGAGTDVVWTSVNALLSALADSVPLSSIDDSTAASGSFLRSIAGSVVWSSLATVIAAVQAGLTPNAPSAIITPGTNNTFVGTNGAGAIVSDIFDNIAANGDVGLAKLDQGGAAVGDILTWNGSSWVKATPATSITSTAVISTNGVLSTAGGTGNLTNAVHTIAHGLGGIPKNVNAVAVCLAPDVGWAAGDEVDIRGFRSSVSNVAGDVAGQDATNITVLFSAAGTLELANKGTGVYAAIAEVNWQVKAYAWR